MAEDEIVVFDGETTNIIGKFDTGSCGLDVLEFIETKTMKKGTVVRCANCRAVTRGSQNLSPGSYRFDAAPAGAAAGAAGQHSTVGARTFDIRTTQLSDQLEGLQAQLAELPVLRAEVANLRDQLNEQAQGTHLKAH